MARKKSIKKELKKIPEPKLKKASIEVEEEEIDLDAEIEKEIEKELDELESETLPGKDDDL